MRGPALLIRCTLSTGRNQPFVDFLFQAQKPSPAIPAPRRIMDDGSGTASHFFGWPPLGPQPLVSLTPGILPLNDCAIARLPDSPPATIAAPSRKEPIRPTCFLICYSLRVRALMNNYISMLICNRYPSLELYYVGLLGDGWRKRTGGEGGI